MKKFTPLILNLIFFVFLLNSSLSTAQSMCKVLADRQLKKIDQSIADLDASIAYNSEYANVQQNKASIEKELIDLKEKISKCPALKKTTSGTTIQNSIANAQSKLDALVLKANPKANNQPNFGQELMVLYKIDGYVETRLGVVGYIDDNAKATLSRDDVVFMILYENDDSSYYKGNILPCLDKIEEILEVINNEDWLEKKAKYQIDHEAKATDITKRTNNLKEFKEDLQYIKETLFPENEQLIQAIRYFSKYGI